MQTAEQLLAEAVNYEDMDATCRWRMEEGKALLSIRQRTREEGQIRQQRILYLWQNHPKSGCLKSLESLIEQANKSLQMRNSHLEALKI